MKRVKLEQTGDVIQKSLSREEAKPLLITSNRKPIAAIIPLDGGDYESLALSLNPEFLAILERSRRSLRENGGIPGGERARVRSPEQA